MLMISFILKRINRVKSVNYHLNKFLSASAWPSLNSLIISAESTACDLTPNVVLFSSLESSFQVLKLLTSTCTFLFHNLSYHYVVATRLFNLLPVRNTSKNNTILVYLTFL